jgi:CBS domain containing-hemolysin-like protein
MEIEADDFTTIAGLVINERGTVPNAGERFEIRGIEVEVREADERRISRLRVRAKPETITDETDETQKQISAGKKN